MKIFGIRIQESLGLHDLVCWMNGDIQRQTDTTYTVLAKPVCVKTAVFNKQITAESNTDHHEDFGKKFSSEQLQHAVENVFPAIVQDVAVTVSQSEYSPCSQLRLGVVTEHDWNVFN